MRDILIPLLAVILLLLMLSAGIEDARRREIANWKNLAIALLAPLWWLANDLPVFPDMALRIGIAAAVFALFVLAFWIGQMGGGDVKMIGALALWFAPQPLLAMLMLMAILGGALTVAMLIDKWWRRAAATPEIPYGVAIAAAGIVSLSQTQS